MYVLGIETTCDETSASVVQDGHRICSLVTFSQDTIHAEFGGVVPEIASRHHIETIDWVVQKALTDAGLTIDDIDRIAVANGPGLVGSLLVGIHFAQGLGLAKSIPVVEVNHIEAHLYASMMNQELSFPALGLVLSGGHTSIILIHGIGKYELIGQTIDDAIGEAFDKVAKMLNLPYPGGPNVEKMALKGNLQAFHFSPAKVKTNPYAFSFSGLKTAVLYTIKEQALNTASFEQASFDIAASFQRAAVETIFEKIELALKNFQVRTVYFGGGVTRNKALRSRCAALRVPCIWPPDELCLDNAAMIAGLGAYMPLETSMGSIFTLTPKTRIPFTTMRKEI